MTESLMNLEDFPGAEFILPGVEDLQNGKSDSIGALLIAIASTRLATAGLDFPKENLLPEPELILYDRLQHERDDAYAYYNALLDSLNSFCHALELNDKLKQYAYNNGN